MSTNGGITDLAEYRSRMRSRGNGHRVVTITGGKGGVGKSVITAGLGAAAAASGKRVLVVDADLGMADLNLLLGVAPRLSALDVLAGEPIENALVPVHGFSLLPALNGSHHLANLDPATRAHLFARIGELRGRFEWAVIDTAPGIHASSLAFAASGTHVVVVMTPEPVSLADAYACLKALVVNSQLRSAYVLANGVRHAAEAEDAVSRLRAIVDRFLGIELIALPWIPRDPAVSAAAAKGVPVVLDAPDAPASRALRNVARELDLKQANDGDPQRPRLFAGSAEMESGR